MPKKVINAVVGIGTAVLSVLPNPVFKIAGLALGLVGSALIKPKGQLRQASATTVQLGEVARQAIVGRAATAGSLVDAFNYGGKYGTDWEVVVLALADHRCDGLEGFFVNDSYVAFTGGGAVPGYGGQLMVWWRPGTEDQTVVPVLLAQGAGWTPDDNGAGVAHVVVAYKADDAEAKNPVWSGGRPRFLWVVRGLLGYDPRADDSVGGAGVQRWADPATRVWSENPIVQRYTWARGIYACDRVSQPDQLLIGRGLSAVEAPPGNLFHRANLCDEPVDGAPRYRTGGIIDASATFISVEQEFAAACAGTIGQPEGSVEIDPGEARAAVVAITDDDLVVGSKVSWNNRMLGTASAEWVNTVVARYVEPAMKWADHAAPVRREVADVLADRQPREERIELGYVTDGAQAGRVAEVRRRLGRLPGRAEITLPPRFAFLEEGDWIQWHSPRRFGAVAFTFRVEAWGSDRSWHHRLQLRQISASVYSDTDPLTDGAVAIVQPQPPAIGAPAAGSWALTAGYQAAGDIETPVLVVTGATDDRAARFVRVEYAAAEMPWAEAGVYGPDVTRLELPGAAGGTYVAAVSYVVDGVPGDRRELAAVQLGPVRRANGDPIDGAIDDAARSAEWPSVTGPGRPADDATNSALPGSPFGPGRTVGEALARLDRVEPLAEAVEELAAVDLSFDRSQQQLVRDTESLAQAMLRLIGEADRTRTVLRDAGVVVDPATGTVRIYAIDEMADRTAKAEVAIDGVRGQIALKASVDYVNEQILLAQVDGDQSMALEQLIQRIGTAETRLDAQAAALELRATLTELATTRGRVTAAEQRLDAVEGAIATKVERTEVDALETRVGSAEGVIAAYGDVSSVTTDLRQATARSDDTALATLRALLTGDAAARREILAQATARQETFAKIEDGLAAEAGQRLQLGARVGEVDARYASSVRVLSDGQRGLGEQVQALGVEADGLAASIAAVAQARVDGDSANAASIQQVRARLDDVGSVGVEQAFQALVDRLGTIEGRYTVSIDVNGNLVGFQLIGGATGPGSLNLINTDLRMGTGRIVFNNGAFMQVMGVGFGAQQDLVEWFGPTMAIADCRRSNAITYKTATGDAYYGGSFAAGTLRNAAASSGLAADEQLIVGPFGSNGKPVRIVASWVYENRTDSFYPATAEGRANFTAAANAFGAVTQDGLVYAGSRTGTTAQTTLKLERATDGAWAELATTGTTTLRESFVGQPPSGDEGGSASVEAVVGISLTVNDPLLTVAPRQLRATLARGFTLSGPNVRQRVSIVAIEE